MENETPKDIKKEELEQKIDELIGKIKSTDNFLEKEQYMLQMGDLRYNQYLETKDYAERQLAKNCYFAARMFRRYLSNP